MYNYRRPIKYQSKTKGERQYVSKRFITNSSRPETVPAGQNRFHPYRTPGRHINYSNYRFSSASGSELGMTEIVVCLLHLQSETDRHRQCIVCKRFQQLCPAHRRRLQLKNRTDSGADMHRTEIYQRPEGLFLPRRTGTRQQLETGGIWKKRLHQRRSERTQLVPVSVDEPSGEIFQMERCHISGLVHTIQLSFSYRYCGF